MVQFDIKRFGRMARWSLTNDKGYYLRQFLQLLALGTLAFVFFGTNEFNPTSSDGYALSGNYEVCCVIVIMTLFGSVIIGPSMMFYSMNGKHDRQALMMLPASNFEKYLMRYANWIIQLPVIMAAFLCADLVQYVVASSLGMKDVAFVMEYVNNVRHDIFPPLAENRLLVMLFISLLSMHSFYALGATFFRNRKYAWVLTTLAVIALSIVQAKVLPSLNYSLMYGDPSKISNTFVVLTDVFYGAWTVLNFWLSYKLFCRTQVKGKFVNV